LGTNEEESLALCMETFQGSGRAQHSHLTTVKIGEFFYFHVALEKSGFI
jgi:hypothetical protein